MKPEIKIKAARSCNAPPNNSFQPTRASLLLINVAWFL